MKLSISVEVYFNECLANYQEIGYSLPKYSLYS